MNQESSLQLLKTIRRKSKVQFEIHRYFEWVAKNLGLLIQMQELIDYLSYA